MRFTVSPGVGTADLVTCAGGSALTKEPKEKGPAYDGSHRQKLDPKELPTLLRNLDGIS